MKPHTKRAVAYIAGRLISDNKSSSIYDYSQSQHFNFSSWVCSDRVSTYDYAIGCHISGNGSSGSFSIYHYGNSAHISLRIDGNRFKGYDYHTNNHFSGRVNGSSIVIYDYEDSQYANYSI